jgi:murein DD-endopeptidase MepM/ murein hydrolase activator NlpD
VIGRRLLWSIAAALLLVTVAGISMATNKRKHTGNTYGIRATGLVPKYPESHDCSPLTSLYASWVDVDGSRRRERHSGVDGGRLGDRILAPAAGTVIAVWTADWGWGDEGALLIEHAREDLNLTSGPAAYYSAFYHLKMSELGRYSRGQRLMRGSLLAHVDRPGGDDAYLPEVHWEVYEVDKPADLTWRQSTLDRPYWDNTSARLVDPLTLLALETPHAASEVLIQPYEETRDYKGFRGFTYILPCVRR